MKSAFTLSMPAIAFLLLSSVASAAPPAITVAGDATVKIEERPLPPIALWYLATGKRVLTHNHGHLRMAPPDVPQPVWKIPAGKFGLQLNDGLRIIGQPAKGWSTTLRTSFGTVTIPLAQITRLEPAGNGQFSAFLKNGDRVTGTLVSKVLSFETQFGTMTVPTPDLVRLSSSAPGERSPPAVPPIRKRAFVPPVSKLPAP